MTTEQDHIAARASDVAAPAASAAVSAELHTLARHSAHYLAGFLGSMALGLVSFPIFTRVFSVAEYGLLDLAQKVVLFFAAGAKMGLQNAALRFYDGAQFAGSPAKARSYYTTMSLGIFGTSAGVACLFLLLSAVFAGSWIDAPLRGLTFWIAALIVLRAAESILCAFLRVEERTKAFNVVTVATKAATILAVCALVPLAGKTASTYFAGNTFVALTSAVILFAWLVKRGLIAPHTFDRQLFRVGIAFGLPLVAYESAFAILGSVDRFLVQHYLGANALGLYSVAYGLSQAVNDVLVTPLNLALMPIYIRLWTSSGQKTTSQFLTMALTYYTVAAIGVLAIAGASADDLIVCLSTRKYAGAGDLIPVLLAGLLIYTAHLFVAAGLLLHKRTTRMAAILIVAAFVNISLNCLLLPRLGLWGGAWAALVSYALCISALWVSSHRLMPLSIDPHVLWKCGVAGLAAWFVGAGSGFSQPWLRLTGSAAIALVVYGGILLCLDTKLRHDARRAASWLRNLLRGPLPQDPA